MNKPVRFFPRHSIYQTTRWKTEFCFWIALGTPATLFSSVTPYVFNQLSSFFYFFLGLQTKFQLFKLTAICKWALISTHLRRIGKRWRRQVGDDVRSDGIRVDRRRHFLLIVRSVHQKNFGRTSCRQNCLGFIWRLNGWAKRRWRKLWWWWLLLLL